MAPYRTPTEATVTVEELLFVGCSGRIAALKRATGEILWQHKLSQGFVSVFLDRGSLYVGCMGHLWCLDPVTGGQRWHNDLPGFGHGSIGLATTRGATHQDAAAIDAAAAATAIMPTIPVG